MHRSSPRNLADRIASLLLAALVAVAASMALASPATAAGSPDEMHLVDLQNQARHQAGLAPLAHDTGLSAVARDWAAELARSNDLRHNPNYVAHVDARVTTGWTRLGENVGYGPSIDVTFGAYMNSSGHRANILGDFNRVGVGAVRADNGRLWTAVVFMQGPATAAPVAAPVDPAQFNGPVDRLYRAYFHRSPDAGGLQHWTTQLAHGMTLGQVSDQFAASAEFRTTYGPLDDAGFVQLVYRNVLGRPAEPAGAGYWTNQMAHGLDRGDVMVHFSESDEFKAATRT